MSDTPEFLDAVAERLFRIAIRDHRCGELLNHLFDGGGVTLAPDGESFVYIPADVIADLAERSS